MGHISWPNTDQSREACLNLPRSTLLSSWDSSFRPSGIDFALRYTPPATSSARQRTCMSKFLRLGEPSPSTGVTSTSVKYPSILERFHTPTEHVGRAHVEQIPGVDQVQDRYEVNWLIQ